MKFLLPIFLFLVFYVSIWFKYLGLNYLKSRSQPNFLY